jgi:hypothetical protein
MFEMFDMAVGFFLLGLVAVAIQQIFVRFLSLEGRGLRSALCGLVRSSKVPTGFREDLLVDRVLADPRIDPTSPGGKPSGAVTTVTQVGQADFLAVLRDVVKDTAPDSLVAGFAKRPDSVRVELRKEIESLPDRVAARAAGQFDRAMSAVGDRARTATARLSAMIGVIVAIVFPLVAGSAMIDGVDKITVINIVLGIFIVPMAATIWTCVLANLKAGPGQDASAPSDSKAARGARRTSRSGGGGAGKAPAKGAEDGKGQPKPKDGNRSSNSASGQRRRGRRSTRRGGAGRSGAAGGGSPADG